MYLTCGKVLPHVRDHVQWFYVNCWTLHYLFKWKYMMEGSSIFSRIDYPQFLMTVMLTLAVIINSGAIFFIFPSSLERIHLNLIPVITDLFQQIYISYVALNLWKCWTCLISMCCLHDRNLTFDISCKMSFWA